MDMNGEWMHLNWKKNKINDLWEIITGFSRLEYSLSVFEI